MADVVGSYVYSGKCEFDDGESIVLDTRGNLATKYAEQYEVLLNNGANCSSAPSRFSGDDTNGYKIIGKTINTSSTITYTAIMPIYIGSAGASTTVMQSAAKCNSMYNASDTNNEAQGADVVLSSCTGIADPSHSWYIDVPSGKTPTVILKDLADKFVKSTNEHKVTKYESVNYTIAGTSHTYDRYVYTGAGYSGGVHKIIVK